MDSVGAPRLLRAEDCTTGFSSGRRSIDIWFRRRAWDDRQTGRHRTYVLPDRETDGIAGLIALGWGCIGRAQVFCVERRGGLVNWIVSPTSEADDPMTEDVLAEKALLPTREFLVMRIGRLAVASQYQGYGHARSLVRFALQYCAATARPDGCFGVVVHPPDPSTRNMFHRFGFQDVPADPSGAMIVRTVDLQRNGFAASA